MPIQLCEITSVQKRADDVYCLTFSSEFISREAQPGQFVHIRVQSELDPLLRRPFSIHDVDPRAEQVDVLFQVAGSGTRILSSKKRGEHLDVLGPLGRGFTMDPERRKAVIVAGGIGIAPFPLLIQRLADRGHSTMVLAGWKTGEGVVAVDRLEGLGATVEIATEDGSRGYKGMVTDLLADRLELWASDQDQIVLYSCGPEAMLTRVADLTRDRRISCQVSLEERMACGIGACYGCAVRGRNRDNAMSEYKLVCRDGPVFDIDEVALT